MLTLKNPIQKIDIYKAGGILIKNRKILITRSKNKDHFITPGGKIEKEETPQQSLIRELFEELTITIKEDNLEQFGIFLDTSESNKKQIIRMDVFFVKKWEGTPVPSNEVEEIRWVDSEDVKKIYTGSIIGKQVIPKLQKQNMID